jgi:2-(1,2-epoxy-1,2-dihydrophenyl)acetyl-CoA isomerase
MQERRAEGLVRSIDARGIARIVIDRPNEHNTISAAAGAALAQAIDEVVAAAPRVVLLTGTGPVFCAGGDIGEFQAHAGALDALVDRILGVLHPAIARLAALPVPVVTALNGSVGGAGVGLALCGDFALAAASMKLRTGYAAIGLSPDAGASWFLARRVGALRARQLFFTSETLDAQRCLEAGIVDAVFANDRLLPEAEALCERLAAAAPGSLAAIKQLCDGAAQRALAEHLALEKSLLEERARSADAREGIAAFLARRAPVFRGD